MAQGPATGLGSLSPPCPAGMRSWKRWQEPPSQIQAQHLGSSGADVTPRRHRLSKEGLICGQQHPPPRCRCSGIPPDPSFRSPPPAQPQLGLVPLSPWIMSPALPKLLRSLWSGRDPHPPQGPPPPPLLLGPSATGEGSRGTATAVAVVTVWLWPSWHCGFVEIQSSSSGGARDLHDKRKSRGSLGPFCFLFYPGQTCSGQKCFGHFLPVLGGAA